MGAFQEGSKDLHALLEVLADSRLRMKGLARGREGSEWERSSIMSELWKELRLAVAKGHSVCLLGRRRGKQQEREMLELFECSERSEL